MYIGADVLLNNHIIFIMEFSENQYGVVSVVRLATQFCQEVDCDDAAGASTAVLPPDTATASATWPTADTTGTVSGIGLPTVQGARASSFASSSLPMYAHVSSKLRTKIWAGEYVDIASLLPDSPRISLATLWLSDPGRMARSPLCVCVWRQSLSRDR